MALIQCLQWGSWLLNDEGEEVRWSPLQVGLAALRGLRGLCILEGIYWAEQQVIESPHYFVDDGFRVRPAADEIFPPPFVPC